MDMTVGGLISAIVVGLVVGALGRLLLPGRQRIGFLLTIMVGMVAAFAGTAIARAIGIADTPGIDWAEIGFQIAVAAVGVGIVAAVMGRRATD
jgi:uncharacterized membrane protein YeaQ/YmgE (transglycosylase-associated protein family)